MFKSSIQRELDSFFKSVSNSDFKIREATKGAFTQARVKLNPWAFERLKEDLWLKVKEFTESEDKERIVSFVLPKKDLRKLTQ